MTDEKRITEMIKEMEQTFAEREALYKDWDEAYDLQFKSLKEREDRLEKEKTERKQIEESLQALDKDLKKREEELLSRERAFQEEKEVYEKNKNETEERFREEQIRLNLLQAKLQNEKISQQTEWLRFEGKIQETNRTLMDLKEETVSMEKESSQKEFRNLLEENVRLKDYIDELEALEESEGRLLKEARELNKQLEEEKQELFRKLLAADNMLTDHDEESIEEEGEITENPEGDSKDKEGNNRFDEFLLYFLDHNGEAEPFETEEDRKGIRIKTEEYVAEIFPIEDPGIEMRIPAEDNKELRKEIQRINSEGGLNCRYERKKKEVILKAPFQLDDEPEDVENLLRCILDYEVRTFKKKGGGQ